MTKTNQILLWTIALSLTVLYTWYLINNLSGMDRLLIMEDSFKYNEAILELSRWY